MVDSRAGNIVLRVVGVIGVVIGVLMVVSSLAQGNVVGIVLGVIITAGAAFAIKRSGRPSRGVSRHPAG